MENILQDKAGTKTLDPRTVFIFQTRNELHMWIGADILAANIDTYMRVAQDYIKIL